MKKYTTLLSFIFIFCFFSCDDENFDIPKKEELPEGQINLRSAGDGDKDLLGFGYDAFYAIADNYKGAKNQVLDINAYEANTPRDPLTGKPYTGFLPKGKIEVALLHGNSSEYETLGSNLNEFYRNTYLSISSNSGKLIPWGKAQFGAEFDSSIDKKSSYSFYKKDICRNVKRLYFSTFSVSRLKYYLTEEFIWALQSYTAQEIVNDFGTHVLVDIYVGGKLSTLVSAKTTSSNSTEVQKFTSDFFDMLKTTSKDSIRVSQNLQDFSLTMVQHGGRKVKTISLKINPGGTIDNSIFDWDEWVNSVDDKSSYLIHSDSQTLIPIYEFVSDPTLKQQIIDLINKRAAQEPNPEPEIPKDQLNLTGWLGWVGGGVYVVTFSGTYPAYMKAGSTISIKYKTDGKVRQKIKISATFGTATIDKNSETITYTCPPTQSGKVVLEIQNENTSTVNNPKLYITVIP